jgi:hypothetical protein
MTFIDPGMGSQALLPPPPEKLFDVKLKRCISSGQIKVKNIPPEDFLVDPNATKVAHGGGRFFADRSRMTRSEAKLKWPDKAAMIDELPTYTLATDDGREKQARDSRFWSLREVQTDPASEEIEIYECYVQVDYDGDGVAEWRQVCMGGLRGGDNILSNEEVGSPPYVSITPNPMPHRYRGRSIYDDVGDIQRAKTVLLRQYLDNLYLSNNQLIAANRGNIENPDALLSPEIGGVVWTNGDPATSIQSLAIQFNADKILGALEYFDMIMEKRTGVSRSTMGMDTDVLQYQTATAVNKTESAAFTKVETYARNIAECGGFKELFSKLLKLFVENQKSVKHIKVRGEFVPMDPRGWNADMNVTINIGLGSGSRDRDMSTLGGIAQKQELAIQALQTPFNPILNIAHAFGTYRKMAETAGLKSPEQFFPEITQEQVMQMAQKMQQSQPPPPEVMKIQGELQMKQMELAQKQQSDQNRAILDQKQAEQKAQIERIQAEADIATQDRKTNAEMILAQQRFRLESELKRQEFAMEQQRQEREFAMEQQRIDREGEIKQQDFALNMGLKRAGLTAQLVQGKKDETGQTKSDPEMIQTAMAELEEIMYGKRDEANTQALLAIAQALEQFSSKMGEFSEAANADKEIVRDPTTGKVLGSRRVRQ